MPIPKKTEVAMKADIAFKLSWSDAVSKGWGAETHEQCGEARKLEGA